MPKRSITGLLTVAPSVGSTKKTRGDPLEAGFAADAAGAAVDVVVAAGFGSLPPHAAAAATVSPTASRCSDLTFMRESPLRHILHKPSPTAGREAAAGGIERQDAVGDRAGEVGVGADRQRGDPASRGGAADVAGEGGHRRPLD